MFHDTKDWCKIWRKSDLCFPKWHKEFGKFFQLKNSNFILETKMVEQNQSENSKHLDQPDAVRKLYFTLEINE